MLRSGIRIGIAGSYESLVLVLPGKSILFSIVVALTHISTYSPLEHPWLYLFFVMIIAILTGVRWHVSVVLIWTPLMAKHVEHIFINFLAISTAFGKRQSLLPVLSGLLVFCCCCSCCFEFLIYSVRCIDGRFPPIL